jgi:hypothetical protein
MRAHSTPLPERGRERDSRGAWRRREFEAGQAAEIEALPARLLVDEVYLGFRP